MSNYKIRVFELNALTEEKTDNILYESIIEAHSRARAVSIAGDILRENGIHQQYKHNYFIESQEVA
jgi:hypothetical protein